MPEAKSDDWLTGNSSTPYSQDEFYLASQDKKGNSKTLYVSAPKHILGELAAMVAKGETPYRTVNDFFRDAIVHRLKYVSDHFGDPHMQEVAKQFAFQARISMDLEQLKGFTNMITDAENALRDSRDETSKKHLIESYKYYAEQMPDYYRGELMNIIRRYA